MNRAVLILTVIILTGIGVYFTIRAPQSTSPSQPVSVETTLQPTGASATESRYVVYSKEAFDNAAGKKRVLFFHATWCPICKAVNEEFATDGDKIPSDIVLFKTDYDTYADLKKKYAITYQHTFVQVDADGNQLAKWNGGGLTELIQNTQ